MAFRVEVLPSAAREIEGLPRPIRRRVTRTIGTLADEPRPHGVVIVRVRHRKDAYR
jgi:mRNA-degrading endonuclease RelE of RelBE toxin-antitoxin system